MKTAPHEELTPPSCDAFPWDTIRMILEGELGNTAGITTRDRCDSCKYFREELIGPDSVETTCRRYPPVVIMDGRSSAYPLVLDDDACGEYAPRG